MPGFNYGGNSIGGDSQFGKMGSNDPYGDNSAGVGAGGTGGANGSGAGYGYGGANNTKTPAQIFAEVKEQVSVGYIPPGWVLEDGHIKLVIPKHTEPYEINGGGRGNDRTGTRTVQERRVVNAELTAAYNDGVAQRQVLEKTSELITDVGEKIGTYLGDKYKEVAREIAGDIKNFQGKTIRSFDDAMKSLNKITSNPAMNINQADRDALVNAWQHVDVQDMANKLGNISTAFKAADTIMKIEKVRENSIVGYQTGDWGPLMREVESWALSGMFAGVAMGVFGAALGALPISGLALTAITITGILTISYLASKIDDNIVNKINNEIIKPAH